jgi:SAM-dependent methyltransferase
VLPEGRSEAESVTSVDQGRACRVCGERDLWQFLDLGAMPPANALLKKDELSLVETRYPLALSHCPSCELIQLTHVVAPEALFQHYVYFSSVSTGMAQHFAALAREVAERFVPPNGLVVEMGSNDGILLHSLIGRPVRIQGVDPARNVAEAARARGVPTIADFFSVPVAGQILREQGKASAILGNNVFAHIDDLDEVMRAMQLLLADNGVVVLEFPYVVDFLQNLEFDTVYLEHLSYFGVRPLARLFRRFDFEIFDVRKQAVHGGTIRVYGRRRSSSKPLNSSVAKQEALELEEKTADRERLTRFARDVAGLRTSLCDLVRKLRADNKRVVGYTAPAKGNVLLNYCGFGPDQIDYLADATPAKQGLYSPGVKIPIRSPQHFRADRPDYALLLAWNHRDEILNAENAYRAAGGKFIIPVPQVQVI